jgi:hypothetical protein
MPPVIVGSGVVTGTVVPNGDPTMVVAYDGRLAAAELGGAVDDDDELVADGVVELVVGVVPYVPTVICACAGGTHANSTQPRTGDQISCERRELIVIGASGHPGTGPMVG